MYLSNSSAKYLLSQRVMGVASGTASGVPPITSESHGDLSLECLSRFFRNLVPSETLKKLLFEAEEYVANAISIEFSFNCDKKLLNNVSATILYTPPSVREIIVEVSLSSEVNARDFIMYAYQYLTSMSCYIEISAEKIYVSKKISCLKALETEFVSIVNSILDKVGVKCALSFSESYKLHWYIEQQ